MSINFSTKNKTKLKTYCKVKNISLHSSNAIFRVSFIFIIIFFTFEFYEKKSIWKIVVPPNTSQIISRTVQGHELKILYIVISWWVLLPCISFQWSAWGIFCCAYPARPFLIAKPITKIQFVFLQFEILHSDNITHQFLNKILIRLDKIYLLLYIFCSFLHSMFFV